MPKLLSDKEAKKLMSALDTRATEDYVVHDVTRYLPVFLILCTVLLATTPLATYLGRLLNFCMTELLGWGF